MAVPKSPEVELLDKLYSVAIEPERFAELAAVWETRLNEAAGEGRDLGEADLKHLASHLRRAEALLDLTLTEQNPFPAPLAEKLRGSAHPMLALDVDGFVQGQNAASETVHGERFGASLRELGFELDTVARIKAFLAKVGSGSDLPPVLLREDDAETGRLSLISLAPWQPGSGRFLVLVKTIDFQWPEKLTGIVRDAFGLTLAEAEVMRLLAQGNIASEIAGLRNASVGTIRAQVRSIYEKTGTRNQTEFLRMALGLTSLEMMDRSENVAARGADRSSASAFHPLAEETAFITLPDGRVMEYADFGAKDGRPCLFLHTEFFGNIWPARGVAAAEARGLRIIAPLRPYYGRSTCPDGSVMPGKQLAADTVTLLDRLGIEKVIPIAQVAGGITAIELIRRQRDRIAGLVLMAPLFPTATFFGAGDLPLFHRLLASVTERHPGLLHFLAKAGYGLYERAGPRRFLARFAHDREGDIALLDDPAKAAMMEQGMRQCTENHRFLGFVADYSDLPVDSMQVLGNFDLPTRLVSGGDVGQKTLDAMQRLDDHMPTAIRMEAEGGGNYLLFSHPEIVVTAASAAWADAMAQG